MYIINKNQIREQVPLNITKRVMKSIFKGLPKCLSMMKQLVWEPLLGCGRAASNGLKFETNRRKHGDFSI